MPEGWCAHRYAMGKRTMAYSLAQAAVAAGRSRSSILRAIQGGRLSAVRDEVRGAWAIEPAELHRVYPVAPGHGPGRDPGHVQGHVPGPDPGPLDAPAATADGTALLAAKDQLIAEQRATIED